MASETDNEKRLRELQEANAAASILMDLVNADPRLGAVTTPVTAANILLNMRNEDQNTRIRTINPQTHGDEGDEETEVEQWECQPRRRIHQSPADNQTTHPTTAAKKRAKRTPVQSSRRMQTIYSRLRTMIGVQSVQKKPVVSKGPDRAAKNSCPICGYPAKRADHLKEHFSHCAVKYGNPTGACWDENVYHEPGTDNLRLREYLLRRRQGASLSVAEDVDLLELSTSKGNEHGDKVQKLLNSRNGVVNEDDEETDEEQWELLPRRRVHQSPEPADEDEEEAEEVQPEHQPSAQIPAPQLAPPTQGLDWMDDEDPEELLAAGFPVRGRYIGPRR